MDIDPADLQDAIGRATKAANRARVLPRWWVALAVQTGGCWYVVVMGRPPYPVEAVYRIRPDFRLKRIVRPPLNLPNLARAMLGTTEFDRVQHPGLAEGWTMTVARLAG